MFHSDPHHIVYDPATARLSSPKRKRAFILISLSFLTLLIYARVANHDFIPYDDDRYITANPAVQQGLTLQSLGWAFTSAHASNWHPLTWISHMIDYELFGLNPTGHHLVNLLLHLINTVVLFVAFTRMTAGFWQSLFVAAMFALHPLHVESVAWAAERKDVLSMLFFALTLWTYARYVERPSRKKFVPVILFAMLGVLSKPMLVTIPFVLLLLDYWPLRRIESSQPELVGTWEHPPPKKWKSRGSLLRALVWEKFWLFVIAVAVSNITVRVQSFGGTVSSVESTPLAMRLSNAAISYITYIRKMFWPSDLAVFYPHTGETITTLSVIAATVLLIITALVVLGMKRFRYLAVGWFLYLGTLVPVIGLVQVGAQSFADRYTYIPLTGLFVMIAWGSGELLERFKFRQAVLTAAGLAAVLACSVVTWNQVSHWRDGITLFEHTLSVTENNWVAHHNLAWELHRKGRLAEAQHHFEETLRIHPTLAVAHYNLGRVHFDQDRNDDARHSFEQALALDPSHQATHIAVGKMLERDSSEAAASPTKPFWRAISYYRQTLEAFPDLEEVHYELGIRLVEDGRHNEAAEHFQQTLKLNPFHQQARRQLMVLGKID